MLLKVSLNMIANKQDMILNVGHHMTTNVGICMTTNVGFYNYQYRHLYVYKFVHLQDNECAAETQNVRLKFSNVPFFTDIVIFCNFQIPPLLSNVPFFPAGYHDFPRISG